MSNNVIISVENLGKKYRISHQGERQRYTALRDVITNKVKGLFKSSPLRLDRGEGQGEVFDAASNRESEIGNRKSVEDFWALKDVSFEVKRGEVVGIIGRNGAGKSTLLKILSRITEPTTGRVHLKGRVASFLEVGTGFHPELTGRENIFLNGAILGMSRAEIRKKFDEIVAFADVEKFLDTPVKRYSSGMYVRLAFAVAAHLEPEILVVDEVLAVGDAQFQKKCLGKMQDISRGGRTVLFVSHNMASIEALCSRCILLETGALAANGKVPEAIGHYIRSTSSGRKSMTDLNNASRRGSNLARIQVLRILDGKGDPVDRVALGEPLQLEIQFACSETIRAPSFGIGFQTLDGRRVLRVQSSEMADASPPCRQGGKVICRIDEILLAPGPYMLTLAIGSAGVENVDYLENCAEFEVEPTNIYGTGRLPAQAASVFIAKGKWIFDYR